MIAALENPEVRKHAVPLTLQQYHTLVNEGVITNDVEFIEGALIEKIPKSPLHEFIILRLFELIQSRLLPNLILRKEAPLSIENSEPEPDISVVKGKLTDFRNAHPTTAEIVAEILVTSHNIDFAKADIYARAQIPEYLIIDALQCRAYLHTQPKNGKYEVINQHDGAFSLEFLDIRLAVKDLMT